MPSSLPALRRRGFVAGAGALAAAAALPTRLAFAQAADYPNKPVRVIVAFTAGGTTDILTRAVSQKLSERFHQTFVVDNKPGAGGNLGTELAARSAPDGYTLLMTASTLVLNSVL